MRQDADQVFQQVLRSGRDEDAHRLLQEFFTGYSLENLRTLLSSSDGKVAKIGAWIVSELGPRAAPLMDTFFALLGHQSRYVRFFVLDAVLACATELDAPLVARGVQLLTDSDDAVRWKALNFIANIPQSVLASSVPRQTDAHLAELTSWMARLNAVDSSSQVAARLSSADGLERLIASAACCRLHESAPHLLELASNSDDVEVSSFASEQLRLR
jgi:hypothetical protein